MCVYILQHDRSVELLKLSSRMMRSGCVLASPCISYQQQSVRCLPVCSVQTNLSPSVVPSDFTRRLSKLLASTLNKPEDVSEHVPLLCATALLPVALCAMVNSHDTTHYYWCCCCCCCCCYCVKFTSTNPQTAKKFIENIEMTLTLIVFDIC